ncbi:hypothetical protein MASR2M15_23340 [Anaerolineales bacterium]
MREVTVQPMQRGRRQRNAEKQAQLRSDVSINDVAASFQEAVTEILVEKTAIAAKRYEAKGIFLAGGVSANAQLRQKIVKETNLPVRYPPLNLCTDNAAMIAAAAYFRLQNGKVGNIDFDVKPMWDVTDIDN